MRLPASSLPSADHKGIGLGKASSSAAVADPGEHATGSNDDDAFWPPPREKLHRTTVQVVSLHNLPKVSHLVLPDELLVTAKISPHPGIVAAWRAPTTPCWRMPQ
eukprot:3631996-Prymnesium_polylepis.1